MLPMRQLTHAVPRTSLCHLFGPSASTARLTPTPKAVLAQHQNACVAKGSAGAAIEEHDEVDVARDRNKL